MPIKIADKLPATKQLEKENIFVMTEKRAARQVIRPLKIAIINLMPEKIKTETQLPLNIENERKRIEQQTGQKVRLTCGANGKGKISIPFSNMEELQRILGMIKE